jgi:hypothetical protein
MHTLIIYVNLRMHRKAPMLVKKTENAANFFAENNGLSLSLEKATKRTFPKLPGMSELRTKYEDCIERDQELNSSFLVNLNRARNGQAPKSSSTPIKATSSSNSLLSQLYSNINQLNGYLNSSHPSSLDFTSPAKPTPAPGLGGKASHSDYSNSQSGNNKLRSMATSSSNSRSNVQANSFTAVPSNSQQARGGKKDQLS